MPEKLPMLDIPVGSHALCDNRFFLNYCTFGYSLPYWKWNDWERLIDDGVEWCVYAITITGQEAIWYNV
jgi:alpha-N-acetylglucosaminidase